MTSVGNSEGEKEIGNLKYALSKISNVEQVICTIVTHLRQVIFDVGEGSIPAERALLQIVNDYVNLRDASDVVAEIYGIVKSNVEE